MLQPRRASWLSFLLFILSGTSLAQDKPQTVTDFSTDRSSLETTLLSEPEPLPDELLDLFKHRWFTIEYILFERLDVLDVNTDEALTQTAPRAWPNNLSQLHTPAASPFVPDPADPVLPEADASSNSSDLDADTEPDLQAQIPADGPINHPIYPEAVVWLDDTTADQTSLHAMLNNPDAECLGYPLWPIPDPVHPSLIPDSPAEVAAAEAARLAELEALAEQALAEPESPDPDLPMQTEADLDEQVSGLQDPSLVEGQDSLADSIETSEPLQASELATPIQPAPDPAVVAYHALLRAVSEYENTLQAAQLQQSADLQLGDATKAINRRSNLRPLLHQRWTQSVPPRDAPQPLLIETPHTPADGVTATGAAKVSGHVAVTVGRYLHLAAQLWYQADTLGMQPLLLPQATLPEPTGTGYFELEESRRMRSEELHYLDHPKFGMIVRIDPLIPPDTLQAQFEEVSNLLEERR